MSLVVTRRHNLRAVPGWKASTRGGRGGAQRRTQKVRRPTLVLINIHREAATENCSEIEQSDHFPLSSRFFPLCGRERAARRNALSTDSQMHTRTYDTQASAHEHTHTRFHLQRLMSSFSEFKRMTPSASLIFRQLSSTFSLKEAGEYLRTSQTFGQCIFWRH